MAPSWPTKIDNSDLWRCTYCEDAALSEDGVADRIPGMLAKIIPEMGADYELVQYSPYRMHQRAATRFREGRVLLAGDAAHATNPTGALGLTSGLFDTWILQEALGAVVRGEAAPEVLDRYAEARRRSFVEDTSPQAVANCQLVYRCTDPAELERRLVDIRRMADDEALVVERSMFTLRLETPSLLTGLRTNDLETAA